MRTKVEGGICSTLASQHETRRSREREIEREGEDTPACSLQTTRKGYRETGIDRKRSSSCNLASNHDIERSRQREIDRGISREKTLLHACYAPCTRDHLLHSRSSPSTSELLHARSTTRHSDLERESAPAASLQNTTEGSAACSFLATNEGYRQGELLQPRSSP